MPVAWDEIFSAFEFVSFEEGTNSAYLCRESGVVYYQSDYGDFEELPDDIEDGDKYIALPSPRDFDLGPRLVMRFAREEIPEHYDKIDEIFSRRGAYRRFKELLRRVNALEKWYAYENAAQEKALREWCAENEIAVEG